MSNDFVKGLTNNHLTWVMVDATDAFTPESALSAATKIKIYGKLRSATGVNFVSSGTGSLTNDIVHVGASALGIYTIALVKADLSDASAAWYDQYIISLSATGAAYQTIIADGGIWISSLSDVLSDLSSKVVVMSGILSDAYSGIVALSDAASNAYFAAVVGSSRILLVQSRLSDLDSRLASEFSDMYSLLSDTRSTMDSQFLVLSNYLSNISAMDSDILSGVRGNSDYLSKMSDVLSNAYSAAVIGASAARQGSSRAILLISTLSDVDSALTSQFLNQSNFFSYLSGAASAASAAGTGGLTASQIANKVWSDYQSKVGASPSQVYSTLLVGASMASDAASAAQQANSRVALAQSMISDVDSALTSQFAIQTSFLSDIDSALTSQLTLHNSYLSDILSAITEALTLIPSGPPKNTAFTYNIKMVLASDHVTPATGLTVAMTRSIDSAAFGAATGVVTELSTGHYKVAASAADMNGTVVMHRFTAATADDLSVEFMTVS